MKYFPQATRNRSQPRPRPDGALEAPKTLKIACGKRGQYKKGRELGSLLALFFPESSEGQRLSEGVVTDGALVLTTCFLNAWGRKWIWSHGSICHLPFIGA